MTDTPRESPFSPPLPSGPGQTVRWSRLYGSSTGLAIARAAGVHRKPVVVLTPDTPTAVHIEDAVAFYAGADTDPPVLRFPDWETLPYDVFSPHQDIVSERLATLYQLPNLDAGILIVPVNTWMTRVPPKDYVDGASLLLQRGDQVELTGLRRQLDGAGYRCVGQVMEHGEFAVRGSLLDLYPMGSRLPFRVDLLDDEVDTIRTFDPETQRSVDRVDEIRMLPAREYPLDENAVARFRQAWRARFEGDPTTCPTYRQVSEGNAPPGIEYYLPLFYEQTCRLSDYLPTGSLLVVVDGVAEATKRYWKDACERYQDRRADRERPPLPPEDLFLAPEEITRVLDGFPQISLGGLDTTEDEAQAEFATRAPLALPVEATAERPLLQVTRFAEDFGGRILFVAETAGRRETLLDILRPQGIQPRIVENWAAFAAVDAVFGITVATLDEGAVFDEPPLAVITEAQIFGQRAMQRRRRRKKRRDAESVIRELAQLGLGAPVVHQDHGVGRYRGLETLTAGGITNEFLTLEYAGGDRLYVPVSSLELITRYTGADPENAPLHKLGSPQWQKARRRAAQKVHDVAAELLELQARRAARQGNAFAIDHETLQSFAQGFPFEETPDQQSAIDDVMRDLRCADPMDRLVCGDVGFGKTEVAMRAAFAAVADGWQVAVLVPTTLLAQQHHQTFLDRFADWPVRVEQLSRFRSAGEQSSILDELTAGQVDIVIGTHKLLSSDVRFKRLGLVVIDEEHRFGVRQKERLKSLRAEVDVLTLTATPIPRTLNMALSDLRDLSLIATPPERRLSIKTFVRQWDDALIREACVREIRRGGQIYFVHNRVEDIEKIAERVRKLVPEGTVVTAHGKLRERELERVMLDFYHQRFNILVCTTIIESGIDVPNANTIVVHRADRFGLAQLHQLRGRVGRSHHRAYAYLLVPPRGAMSNDAVKRLEAIESLEELGIGFSLASHDMEIRGAGELLGEDQSGQIHEVGYALYTEMLERAVRALKAGLAPELDRPLDHGAEVDLRLPALIPDDYLPDVHTRLIMYKRPATAENDDVLQELEAEMVDRFGQLPDAARALFQVARLKLRATPLGIAKLELGAQGGRLVFGAQANVDPARVVELIEQEPASYRLVGSDKLRIIRELPDAQTRIAAADEILRALTTRDAA
ncbi:MAG: transcription-repair coupling factor [Gammaproteobacteria bacterium]|nr:MAG: transcription-repair coupling factor [Gammaproteobacteria bacterium]